MKPMPLVSVNVLTYNSKDTILETLESIKAQSYQNIELIISDDKSTDNTVQVCEEWISKNKERFSAYKIIVPAQNTGQAGNYNRAFDACSGEWIKEIDGDDILLPNCLEDLMDYVQLHPDAKYVFGRMEVFGKDEPSVKAVSSFFDYNIFQQQPQEQLHRLLFDGNCIPSPTSFYNKAYMLELNYRNDERIPNMEDWPKWINLIRLGVRFHYLDKTIVGYRAGDGISTCGFPSERYFRTNSLMLQLYCYPEWIKENQDLAISKIAAYHEELYQIGKYYKEKYERVQSSPSFRIGHIILTPLRLLKNILGKNNQQ